MITKFTVPRKDIKTGVNFYPVVEVGTRHFWPSCYECEWTLYGNTVAPGYITF
jgi:hypothetical protein